MIFFDYIEKMLYICLQKKIYAESKNQTADRQIFIPW